MTDPRRIDDEQRAENLVRTAHAVAAAGTAGLSDSELLDLLAEHRWAVARLSSRRTPLALRSRLNAAVLKIHGVLHRTPRRITPALGPSLRRVARGLAISGGFFCAAAVLTFTAVLSDPILAISLVPRELLLQIDPSHWGSRGSVSADAGMTLFYWSNNLRAAFVALGLGVLGGYPAMLVIGFNGALLGAVAAASLTRGAGPSLLGWIAPHGVPELGGVILCGAIGWELGRSWIVPGWRTRRAALAEAGRVVTPMVLVAALLIIAAAPIEGFVAPLDLPGWVDGAIAGGWILFLLIGARAILRVPSSAEPTP